MAEYVHGSNGYYTPTSPDWDTSPLNDGIPTLASPRSAPPTPFHANPAIPRHPTKYTIVRTFEFRLVILPHHLRKHQPEPVLQSRLVVLPCHLRKHQSEKTREMPSIREDEGKRFAAHQNRADIVEELIKPRPHARLDEEWIQARLINDATTRTFKRMAHRVLMQMDFNIINAVALGTLPQEIRGELELLFTNDYVNLGNNVPGVYVNYVTDKDGIPPTKADTIGILSIMREYIEGSEDLIEQVDAQFSGKSGEWRYASTVASQQAQLRFIEGIETRLDLAQGSDTQESISTAAESITDAPKPPSDTESGADAPDPQSDAAASSQAPEMVDAMELPILCGISEVGFSITPYRRIRQHQNHSSSNDIMNLFEAAAKYLFGNRYGIEGYVVARIVDPTLVSLSEVLVSRLACAYTDFGGGFNGKLAGLNVQGLNNLPIIQKQIKEQDEKAREFLRKAREQFNPNWIKEIEDLCRIPDEDEDDLAGGEIEEDEPAGGEIEEDKDEPAGALAGAPAAGENAEA
ncbi:hypothetical protein V498_09783 [Pseudogymnoascus sp. VKM F-4517 (FW-2822)]|nr:hypothetical protein V498_09783 [Pseudogymnoascus sp. VKM F-4517 (FW-2822)]